MSKGSCCVGQWKCQKKILLIIIIVRWISAANEHVVIIVRLEQKWIMGVSPTSHFANVLGQFANILKPYQCLSAICEWLTWSFKCEHSECNLLMSIKTPELQFTTHFIPQQLLPWQLEVNLKVVKVLKTKKQRGQQSWLSKKN